MPGGYFVIPHPPSGSQFVLPTSTEQHLTDLSNGVAVARTPARRAELRSELRRWRVQAVVAAPVGADPVGFFTWLVGRPPDSRAGGMIEWYRLTWTG